MKIEVGKTYETSDGRLARVICVDRKFIGGAPVIALVACDDGMEWICGYSSEGISVSSENDLIREYIPVTYKWARVFEDGVGDLFDERPCAGSLVKGFIKLAFGPEGKLILDKCEITGV